jgi:hypothetical protein
MLLKELLSEALAAKDKKALIDEAARLMKVDASDIIDISDMFDALYWENKVLDKSEVGDEKLTLKGENSQDGVRVVHVLRTDNHDNFLFSTKRVLKNFISSQQFEDDMLHHFESEGGDRAYASKVLDKYQKHGLAPRLIINRLKSIAAELGDDSPTKASIQQRIDKYSKALSEAKMSDDFRASSKRFADALVSLVRDENDPELSEDELKAAVAAAAKKHNLNAEEKKRLALAAEGPIGY